MEELDRKGDQDDNIQSNLLGFLFMNICTDIRNTSLNIKGMPIVNDLKDAKEFSKKYGVPVHTRD